MMIIITGRIFSTPSNFISSCPIGLLVVPQSCSQERALALIMLGVAWWLLCMILFHKALAIKDLKHRLELVSKVLTLIKPEPMAQSLENSNCTLSFSWMID